jgi:hypothetical protein
MPSDQPLPAAVVIEEKSPRSGPWAVLIAEAGTRLLQLAGNAGEGRVEVGAESVDPTEIPFGDRRRKHIRGADPPHSVRKSHSKQRANTSRHRRGLGRAR